MFSAEARKPLPELEMFFEEASPELRALSSKAIEDVIYMMLVNSPIVSFVMIMPILFARIRAKVVKKAWKFFEGEVVNGGDLLLDGHLGSQA